MQKGFRFSLTFTNTMGANALYVGNITAGGGVTVEWARGGPGLLSSGQSAVCVCTANSDMASMVLSGNLGRDIPALAPEYTITYTDHMLFDMQTTVIGVLFAISLEGSTDNAYSANYKLKAFN